MTREYSDSELSAEELGPILQELAHCAPVSAGAKHPRYSITLAGMAKVMELLNEMLDEGNLTRQPPEDVAMPPLLKVDSALSDAVVRQMFIAPGGTEPLKPLPEHLGIPPSSPAKEHPDTAPIFLMMALAYYCSDDPKDCCPPGIWYSPAGARVHARFLELGMVSDSGTPTRLLKGYVQRLMGVPPVIAEGG